MRNQEILALWIYEKIVKIRVILYNWTTDNQIETGFSYNMIYPTLISQLFDLFNKKIYFFEKLKVFSICWKDF